MNRKHVKSSPKRKLTEKLVEDAFLKALDTISGEFTDDEINKIMVDYLGKLTNAEKNRVTGILDKLIVSRLGRTLVDRYDDESGGFVLAKTNEYFTGAKFRVKPTQYELENGILVPGHRFIPFCSSELKPYDMTLVWHGKELKKKEISGTVDELMIFHTLLGVAGFFETARSNDEIEKSGIVAFGGNASFSIDVFDFSDIYKALKVKAGDSFQLEVLDYEKGICDVTPIEPADPEDIQDWLEALEFGLHSFYLNWDEGQYDIGYELGSAFFSGGRILIMNPALHIGGFLSLSSEFQIGQYNGHGYIVPVEDDLSEDEEEEWDSDDFFDDDLDDSAFDGLLDNTGLLFDEGYYIDGDSAARLDDLLMQMGYSCVLIDIEAYMRDELYRGGKSVDAVIERCLDDRIKIYREKDELLDLLNKLWNAISKDYNRFADDQNAKIRSRILGLTDKKVQFARKIDSSAIQYEGRLRKNVQELGEISVQMTEILYMLNNTDEVMSEEIQKQLNKSVDTMEFNVNYLISETEKLLR